MFKSYAYVYILFTSILISFVYQFLGIYRIIILLLSPLQFVFNHVIISITAAPSGYVCTDNICQGIIHDTYHYLHFLFSLHFVSHLISTWCHIVPHVVVCLVIFSGCTCNSFTRCNSRQFAHYKRLSICLYLYTTYISFPILHCTLSSCNVYTLSNLTSSHSPVYLFLIIYSSSANGDTNNSHTHNRNTHNLCSVKDTNRKANRSYRSSYLYANKDSQYWSTFWK